MAEDTQHLLLETTNTKMSNKHKLSPGKNKCPQRPKLDPVFEKENNVKNKENQHQKNGLQLYKVSCEYSKELKVYIQSESEGNDPANFSGKLPIVTVHDVGTNHESLLQFAMHSEHMAAVRRKTVFLHVCLPGQDFGDEHLGIDYEYPTLVELAHDIKDLLDAFDLRTCIGLGEGLGASVLIRLGLYHPNRVLGLILADCQAPTARVDEFIKCKVYNWKEGGSKVADKLMRYVKLGTNGEASTSAIKGTRKNDCINPHNLGKLLDVYLKRADISKLIAAELKVEAMIVTGSKSPCVQASYALNRLNSRNTTLVIVDGVHDALREADWNVTRAFILFCKGCGMLLSVPMLGLEKEFETVNMRQQMQQEGGKASEQGKRMVPQSESQMEIAKAILEMEYRHQGDMSNADDQH